MRSWIHSARSWLVKGHSDLKNERIISNIPSYEDYRHGDGDSGSLVESLLGRLDKRGARDTSLGHGSSAGTASSLECEVPSIAHLQHENQTLTEQVRHLQQQLAAERTMRNDGSKEMQDHVLSHINNAVWKNKGHLKLMRVLYIRLRESQRDDGD